jgi:hypothetical protein
MSQVYSLAHRVIVWLGSEASNSTLALQTLDHLGQQCVATRNNQVLPSPEAQNEKKAWYKNDALLP